MTLPFQSEDDEMKGNHPALADLASNDSFMSPRKLSK